MVDTILDNISLRSQRRAEVNLEIGLSAKPADLKNIIPAIRQLLQQNAIEASTVFSDTGKMHTSSTLFILPASIRASMNSNELREQINFSIIELLATNNLELAAASTDIVVKEKKSDFWSPAPGYALNFRCVAHLYFSNCGRRPAGFKVESTIAY